jgi:RHS repeat-associated protein
MRRKLVCLALILSLLILPSQDTFIQPLSVFASTTIKSVTAPVGYIPALFKWLFGAKPVQRRARKETPAERINAISRVQISPNRFVGYQEQSHKFNALLMNANNQAIYGVKPAWESSNPEKVQIDDSGKATFLQPGQARIICRVGNVEASVPVQVRPGNRPIQSDAEWRNDQSSLTPEGGASGTTGTLLRGLMKQLLPTVEAQSNGPSELAYDELYTDPKNLIGSPSNRVVEVTRIGTVLPEGSNATFAIPLVGLGGRGVGASLALFYNSRIWSRRNNTMAFDAINGEPSPGFSLGLGRLVSYDHNSSNNTIKLMWVEADGTRHLLGTGPYSGSWNVTATDGSDIDFGGSVTNGGDIRYPNGTSILVQPVNNRLLPTQILDRNGNYVQIAYKDSSNGFAPLSLDYVTDTMGRVIQFNYDGSYRLTSIDAPGLGGDSQNPVIQTVARFDYQTVNVTTNFSGLTIEKNANLSTTSFLKRIYFPATNNGCIFTYSGYGMITTVSLRRAMSLNLGVIQDGTQKANVAYNYPTSGSTQLTDAPTFTERTESAENAPTSTFTYSSSTDGTAQTKTFTITQPNSSTVNLTRSTNSSSVANNLLTKTEIKNGSTTYFKSEIAYVTAASAPQVESVILYDDTNTPTKVGFSYDSYGNVTDKREYGYQVSSNWVVRRRTHFTYNTSLGIQGLVTLTEIYDGGLDTNDGNDNRIAKSSITYDDYQAMGGMEGYTGQSEPPGHLSSYGTSVTARGNVTGTTVWYDLANNLSITRLMKLDKFGNVLKEQVACCNVRSYGIPNTNCWSSPQEVISGDESGLHLDEEIDSDFNTGLVVWKKNAQGKEETFDYDAALRMRQVNLFTGATAETTFNDGTLTTTSTFEYQEFEGESFEVTRILTTTKNHDGWGRVISEINPYGVQVNTTYNSMGQVSSVSNPFASGGSTSYSTSYNYDTLGRQTLATLPDSNTVQTAYSGATVTVTDQVNRKIKREVDSLGRLIKVTEQNVSSGTLNQETSYTYNLLDILTEVNQGGQYRKYKFDDAGRMLFENIPEQTATINDGTGTYWTSKYTYTNFNAVATRTDARGVITTYGYNTMNKMVSISYNTSGASNVATTSSVAMTYSTTGSTKGLLTQVSNGTITENYSYNSSSQVSSVARSIDSKSYTTSYEYNQGGQLSKLTYPSSYNYFINHDNKGRLESLSSTSGNGLTNGSLYGLTYNTVGQQSGLTLGNGVVESYGYSSDRMQLTSQSAVKSGTTLLSLTYGYSASSGQNGSGSTAGNSGQLMSISGSIGGQTENAAYTYDNLGRLVTSNQTTNGVSAQRRFAYDRWGNRTGVWDQTSGGTQIQIIALENTSGIPNNRLDAHNTQGWYADLLYDANGNVTNDGAHTYIYDAENRVVSVDSGFTATYNYDHQNRRIKTTVGSTTTHYIWEGGQVLAEHNGGTGAVITNYTYAGSRMISKTTSGTTSYFLNDRLSARVVLNTNGSIIGRQAHLPFGEELNITGTTDKHRLTNYEGDSETATDYAVNRQYNQNIGRFNRVDPYDGSYNMAVPQSLNRYAYVQGDPLNNVDPLGLNLVTKCHLLGYSDEDARVYYCHTYEDGLGNEIPPSSSGGPSQEEVEAELDRCINDANKKFSAAKTDLVKKYGRRWIKLTMGGGDETFTSFLGKLASAWFNWRRQNVGAPLNGAAIIAIATGALVLSLSLAALWFVYDVGSAALSALNTWHEAVVQCKNYYTSSGGNREYLQKYEDYQPVN